ncbi:hypothetical protein EV102420_08_03650 [Pseudescherichia vulneris NBRC 102420]|uniref:Uncharacterized protein n=1 Tax=Pseudescherichia vulneris NBRC 102420 TaxID=1115515 RepID=A0A090VRY7_PSEVU|nr:hypothetical protein EV102420_08_03650 [Pseudescherichia vulneris NBRC 102420]
MNSILKKECSIIGSARPLVNTLTQMSSMERINTELYSIIDENCICITLKIREVASNGTIMPCPAPSVLQK